MEGLQLDNSAGESKSTETPRNHETDESNRTTRATLAQVFVVCGFGTLLLGIGLVFSMPTIVIGGLLNKKNESFFLDDNDASWFGSIIFISQPLGSVASGFLQDTFGRKKCMMAVNVPITCGWILLYYASSTIFLYVAATVQGLSLGFMEAPVLSYIGEVTQPHLRGVLSSLGGSFAGVGVLLMCFIGALTDWRNTCAISTIAPVISFIVLSMIPESPTWLIAQGRTTDAEKALCCLRGWVHPIYIRQEFLTLIDYIKSSSRRETIEVSKNIDCKVPGNHVTEKGDEKIENIGVLDTFTLLMQPKLYRPLRMVLLIFFISHCASLLAIRPFLVGIFIAIGMPIDPYWVLVISGGLQIIGALFGMFSMRLQGKRKTNIFSLVVCTVCCFILAISLSLKENIPWIQFGAFCTLFFASGFGIVPLPWALISEVYPLEGRGIAGGLSAAASYLEAFIVTKTYINLSAWFELHGALYIYGIIGTFGLIYIYYCLPETEGVTLEEIENYFKNKKSDKP